MNNAARQLPEPDQINDAWVYGNVSEDILTRTVSQAFSKFGRDRSQSRYRNVACTVRDVLNHRLTVHPVGKEKDGEHLLSGSLVGYERNTNAVDVLYWLTLDLDCGDDIETVRAKVQSLGLFAVLHTSWSNQKNTTDARKDSVLEWIGTGATDATRDEVCSYLSTVKRYRAHVLKGAELLETVHTNEGIKYRLRHQPMTKLRAWFLLDKPFIIAERGARQADAIAEWKARYRGMAKLLDVVADRACVDPARLWYLPRHPAGADWRCEVIAGKALDIDTVERVTVQDERRAAMGAFEQAAAEMGSDTYKTADLKRFAAKYGDRFQIEDFLQEMDPEGERGSANGGHLHRCPNDERHIDGGNEEDKAFWCKNGEAGEGFVATCRHDACAGLDRLNHLDLICEQVGITDAMELKKRWVPPEASDDEEEKASSGVVMPPGFGNHDGFLCYVEKDQDDKTHYHKLCGALDVQGITRDEEGHGWGLLIAYKDRAGTAREITLRFSDVLSDPGTTIATLADAGLRIAGDSKSKARLFSCLSWITADRTVTTATKTGWHGKAFLPPVGDVIGGDKTTLRLAEAARPESTEPVGTLAGWQHNVAEIYAVCDFHCSVALGGEFAGPLVGLMDASPIMVSLTGDSSCGKSLSMRIASAGSGDPSPKKGSFITAYGTAVGLEERISRANHRCLYIDELRLMDPRDLDKLVMSYSSGSDRDRGKAQGGLRRTRTFTGAAVASNEKGMRETIEGAGVDYVTGIGVRCIDVDVSGARTCDDAARVANLEMAIGDHYGHALPLYIRHLQAPGGYVENTSKLVERIAARVSWLLGDGQHKAAEARAARILATFMVGLEIAREANVLPSCVNQETIEAHYRTAWSASVGNLESDAVNDADKAPQHMQGRLLDLWDVHGWDEDQEAIDTPPDGRPRHLNRERLFHAALCFSDKTQGGFLAVRPEGFAKLLPKGVKVNAVKKLLHRHGLMLKRDDRQYTFYDMPVGIAPYPHYRLDARYFGPKADLPLHSLLSGKK